VPRILKDMGGDSADGADDEVIDHALTRVLAKHGPMLDKQARVLIATGVATVTVPGMTLQAQLRPPKRWRGGLLEYQVQDLATGQVTGASSITLRRAGGHHRPMSLADEVAVHLAMGIVYGPPSQPGS
jgi:hypothetical protein